MKEIVESLQEKYGNLKIRCEGSNSLPIDTILNFQGNLKKLKKENLEKLIKSLYIHGFIAPFFVWNNGGDWYILDGHGRLQALLKIRELGGITPGLFPVSEIHAESEEEARAMLLAITSQFGEFQKDVLDDWVSELDQEIAESLRIVDTELELSIASLSDADTEGDDDVEEDVPHITKLGDLWELGSHRLLCGDSTKEEDIEKLMGGQKADMVFTDPPYGMCLNADYSSAKSNLKMMSEKGMKGGRKYENVIGDHEDFTPELITTVFLNFGYCKEIFLWGADYYAEHLENKNDGSWVVWDKRLDESADKMYGSTFELCWSKKKHKRMLARIKWAGVFGTEKEHDHKRHHPTQKPVELVDWFFDYYSLADKKRVVDLYGGSGATLLSSEKNDKQAFLMELDPHYCDVIVNRYKTWCEKNGKDPIIKLNGETHH